MKQNTINGNERNKPTPLNNEEHTEIKLSIDEMELTERDKHIIAAQKLLNKFTDLVDDRSKFEQPITADVDQMVEMRAYLREVKRHLDKCDGIDTEEIHNTRVWLLMAIQDVKGEFDMPVWDIYDLRSALINLCYQDSHTINIERELEL